MPYKYFGIKTEGNVSVLFGTPHYAFGYDSPFVQRSVTLNQQTGGTIDADLMSGYDGDIITLSNTADAGYTFNTYNITGATLTGNQFMFSGSDVTAEPDYTHNVYNVSITQVAGGTVAASPSTGYYGTQVTLSNTPSSEYTFGSYSITGATLTSNKFNFEESNVTAKGSFTQKTYTLTLQTDGHGKLAASKTTGHKGDTVTLTPTYSSYYRFNNYSQTGGSINGNTFTFGSQNATAKANFKVNAFTATGGFEKGSNVTCNSPVANNGENTANVGAKYAVHGSHTGSVPTAWYNTSNRWKVTSTVSAYKITLNTKMKFGGGRNNTLGWGSWKTTGWSFVGSTTSNSQNWTNKAAAYYNKSFTSNATGVNYGVNGKLEASSYAGKRASAQYIAAGTSGTWTATGYIP